MAQSPGRMLSSGAGGGSPLIERLVWRHGWRPRRRGNPLSQVMSGFGGGGGGGFGWREPIEALYPASSSGFPGKMRRNP